MWFESISRYQFIGGVKENRKVLKICQRLLSFSLLCIVFICLIIPAHAESFSIDYYVSDVYTKNGTPYVTVDFPVDYACWVRKYNMEIRNEYLNTASINGWIQHRALNNFLFLCYPLGYSGNYIDSAFNRIDITEFPDVFDLETSCNLALTWDSSLTEAVTVTVALEINQVDYTGSTVYESDFLYETVVSSVGPLDDSFTQHIPLNFDVDFNKADDAVGLIMYYIISFSGITDTSDTTGITYVFENERCAFDFSITEEFYEELQKGETNRLLGKIEDHLVEQNKTLDDIYTGGSAGDDLIAGGDRIEDAGAGLGDDIGAIQDFEEEYMGQLDDNIDEVLQAADLTWLYPALGFVQRYLNKIVAAIPSKYLIVFTLPMFFGLFMYIVGHPIRAPRPDTSGDEVTREIFTQTHILTGKGAGSVRSTRTVTTSREIGRVHNE